MRDARRGAASIPRALAWVLGLFAAGVALAVLAPADAAEARQAPPAPVASILGDVGDLGGDAVDLLGAVDPIGIVETVTGTAPAPSSSAALPPDALPPVAPKPAQPEAAAPLPVPRPEMSDPSAPAAPVVSTQPTAPDPAPTAQNPPTAVDSATGLDEVLSSVDSLAEVDGLVGAVVAPITTLDSVAGVLDPTIDSVAGVLDPVVDLVSPVIDPVLAVVPPIVDGVLDGVTDTVVPIVDAVLPEPPPWLPPDQVSAPPDAFAPEPLEPGLPPPGPSGTSSPSAPGAPSLRDLRIAADGELALTSATALASPPDGRIDGGVAAIAPARGEDSAPVGPSLPASPSATSAGAGLGLLADVAGVVSPQLVRGATVPGAVELPPHGPVGELAPTPD